ncbi:MAG TPA: histidine kinase, partial [Thalassospira sp.]|nr:histidine kinase [Thalassospira sp.]
LENVIERAAILAHDGKLHFDLPEQGARDSRKLAAPTTEPDSKPEKTVLTRGELRQTEYDNIIHALTMTKGKVFGENGAAALLDIKPTTLASRIKK